MKKRELKEFIKRYDKFKNNNLPTPFWDDERQTLEYVFFDNELEVRCDLQSSLEDIAFTGLYYPFTAKVISAKYENNKLIEKEVIGHQHAHSLEEVLKYLYSSPESFKIEADDEVYYSKQELDYIRRIKKYLLLIDLKDIKTGKIPVSRYRSKKQNIYGNSCIYNFNDNIIKQIIDDKLNFRVCKYYKEYPGDKKYNPKEFRALIVDKEDNFKLFIEYTERKLLKYKDIKDKYKLDNIKDDDRVIVEYFKVLEKF